MAVTFLGSNISEKYKCEWVAPERTGSRKVAEILSYFGFTNNGKPIFFYGDHKHSHLGPDQKYGDYTLISNARNPYGRTYSIFKNFFRPGEDKSKESFKEYLKNDLKNGNTLSMVVNPFFTKTPDYIIRLEHMVEDLLKIPFILDVLSENQVKMLSFHEKPLDDWEQFYDEESKEIVYNLTKHHFEYWGYEK